MLKRKYEFPEKQNYNKIKIKEKKKYDIEMYLHSYFVGLPLVHV